MTTGEVAKGILIFCCGYFLFMALVQAASGQTALAVFMFVGFSLPLTYVIYGYAKDRKRKAKTKVSTS
jgi:membrane protein implicated in regulation of membrane protease activity